MRVLQGQVSNPPPGFFDFTSTDIVWLDEDGPLAALLLTSRFKDIRTGEENRGLTQFWHRDRNVSETIEVRTFRLSFVMLKQGL
jgi:hypothetical protein